MTTGGYKEVLSGLAEFAPIEKAVDVQVRSAEEVWRLSPRFATGI